MNYKTDSISTLPPDLRLDAEEAIALGQKIEVHVHQRNDSYVGPVTTLVIDGERAGQATNGSADWGDWDARTKTLTTDAGARLDLDGREVVS